MTLGADPFGAPIENLATPAWQADVDAWIARGDGRTVKQDDAGWWVAREGDELKLRRKDGRVMAARLKGMP